MYTYIFFRPYGWIAPKNWTWHYAPIKPIKWEKYMSTSSSELLKPKSMQPRKYESAAWLVSNCDTSSDREDYVEELQKYFPIHTYGRCGLNQCPDADDGPTYDMNSKCFDFISKNYMFYLSFENSLCADYVTEKFFKALTFGIVPVVLGGAKYSEIAPPKSYINVADFTSPKDLANHLQHLVKNQTAYQEYFQWKNFFKVYGTKNHQNRAMCQLCEALNDENRKPKIYQNMDKWWKKGSKCEKEGRFPWSNPEKTTTAKPSAMRQFFNSFIKVIPVQPHD